MPRKLQSLNKKERPILLSLHHKLPCNLDNKTPTPKHHIRSVSRRTLFSRRPLAERVHKNPEALVEIARKIAALPDDVDASQVLDQMSPFIRKGSLSLTIRELGHMGLPHRALQTLLWVQNHQPALFPDDRSLASALEILARDRKPVFAGTLDKHLLLHSASRTVVEAIARGFIASGQLHRARKLLLLAKDSNRTLDPGIHAKLIAAAGKTPDGYRLASVLLEELGEREDFYLEPQDCTAVMKVCVKLGKFELVESLFEWFKASGRSLTVVMYTTVVHSRYCSRSYREGMKLVWEMEQEDFLFDLPAYRVVIRLSLAIDDLARAARYFSKLKEAGFTPTYDIYRDMIRAYAAFERLAKCKQIIKEAEREGWKLDRETQNLVSKLKGEIR